MASVFQCDICGSIMNKHVSGQCILYKYDTCREGMRIDKRLDLCGDCYSALTGFLKARKEVKADRIFEGKKGSQERV